MDGECQMRFYERVANPLGVHAVGRVSVPVQTFASKSIEQWRIERYRELWAELHSVDSFDAYAPLFADWCNRVRQIGGCDCGNWLAEYCKRKPVQFGGGFKAWAVDCHNAVNEKLGKPIWRVQDE